jgi:hypothetical protein
LAFCACFYRKSRDGASGKKSYGSRGMKKSGALPEVFFDTPKKRDAVQGVICFFDCWQFFDAVLDFFRRLFHVFLV